MPRNHPHAPLAGLMIACFVALVASVCMPAVLAQEQEYDVRFVLTETAELNMQMRQDDTIEWTVRVVEGDEIYLDFHSHDAGRVEFHERFDSTRVESKTFTAPADRIYSIYLVNNGDEEATIEMEVSGQFEVDSESNIDPVEANGSPTGGAVLVLSASIAVGAWVHSRRSS